MYSWLQDKTQPSYKSLVLRVKLLQSFVADSSIVILNLMLSQSSFSMTCNLVLKTTENRGISVICVNILRVKQNTKFSVKASITDEIQKKRSALHVLNEGGRVPNISLPTLRNSFTPHLEIIHNPYKYSFINTLTWILRLCNFESLSFKQHWFFGESGLWNRGKVRFAVSLVVFVGKSLQIELLSSKFLSNSIEKNRI